MIKDLRLRILHFYRKNKKIIFIGLIIFTIVFMVNQYLKHRKIKPVPKTTYEPHISVMDSTKSVPSSISKKFEEMIDEYMEYCNSDDWVSAYNMLSSDCKKYAFQNDLTEYMKYQYTKMPTPKKHAIQDYSNDGNLYIYQVKYIDDYLATGLTGETYNFTEEKITFKKGKDGKYEMAVGNFINKRELKNVFENDYIKIDLDYVVQFYSIESYVLKITNRTDNIIVIANNTEENEVALKLESGDYRKREDMNGELIIPPNGSRLFEFDFPKFYDNENDASSIFFNSIRVFEEYNGVINDLITDEDIANEQSYEEKNAIAKFSVNLPIRYKD